MLIFYVFATLENIFIATKSTGLRGFIIVASIKGSDLYLATFPGVAGSINLCVATILRVTQYVDLAHCRTQLVCQGLIFGNGRAVQIAWEEKRPLYTTASARWKK